MADSLKVQLKSTYTPDSDSYRIGDEIINPDESLLQFTREMTGTNTASGTQTIGTTEEALDLISDLSTDAFIIIKNTDGTNFVEVGLTGSYAMRIEAKEMIAFRANGVIYCKADTASVQVQFWAYQK